MTYVEFFDKATVENVCACLAQAPERVVLVGHDRDVVAEHIARYKALLSGRGYANVEFVPRTVNPNKLDDIVELLSDIVENYDDCVIDLTGGEDLVLVAVGIVKERYAYKNVQFQRLNLYTNRMGDCDGDGITIMASGTEPSLSVAENVALYGGEVVFDETRRNYTPQWNVTESLVRDVRRIWEVCRQNAKDWNKQIGTLKALSGCCMEGDGSLKTTAALSAVQGTATAYLWDYNLLQTLYMQGFLLAYSNDFRTVSVTYRDEFVKAMLTMEGRALEMKVFVEALACKDAKGAVYNDVLNGVVIDWDGVEGTAENEIDVLLMHGIIPVFVSCKNGTIEKDEVYKLNAVSQRFGTKYAKRVLVSTAMAFARQDTLEEFKDRTESLDILLVTDVHTLSDEQWQAEISTWWKNTKE